MIPPKGEHNIRKRRNSIKKLLQNMILMKWQKIQESTRNNGTKITLKRSVNSGLNHTILKKEKQATGCAIKDYKFIYRLRY